MNTFRKQPAIAHPMKNLLSLGICSAALLLAAVAPATRAQTANPPGKVAYQGFLTDLNGTPFGNTTPTNITVVFRIFGASSGGATKWSSQQTVTIDKGHFSVLLGEGSAYSSEPFAADLSNVFTGTDASDRFLELSVGNPLTTISPRIQFLPGPYALLAKSANQLVDNTGAAVLSAVSGTVTLKGLVSSTNFNGTFAGNGLNLTNLNGANINAGTVALAQLAANSVDNTKLATNAVDSGKILDGTIVNADISASANIADTKLGTISTAGKVSDSALTANVALLNRAGQTFTSHIGAKQVSSSASLALYLADPNGGEKGGLGLAGVAGQYSTDAAVNDITFRNLGGKLLFQYSSGASAMSINTANLIGVGVSSASKARLEVVGGVAQNGLYGTYLNAAQVGGPVTHGTHTYSIYSSGAIWVGDAVIVTSDRRAKNVLGRSDREQDLRTLLGIEITDYNYKDKVQHGNGIQKKVIAQQVEKVFPQAVSQATNTVPDIYKAAKYEGGWIRLATDLKKGERVSLTDDKKQDVFEVLEVSKDGFRTAFRGKDGQEIFVYGREVADFRTVDYEAISMLNVSATQQIKAEKDAEIKSLREENASLSARLASLEKETAQMRKLVAELAAVRSVQPSTTVAQASR
jgi:hypothetical protein